MRQFTDQSLPLSRKSLLLFLSSLCLLAALLCPFRLSADIIQLDEGQSIQGVILRQTNAIVEVQTSGGRLSLPRNRIKSIESESPEANMLQETEANLRRGQILEAANEIEETLRRGLSEKEVRIWCASKGELFEHALKTRDAGPMLRWTGIFRQLAHLPEQITSAESTKTISLIPSGYINTNIPSTPTLTRASSSSSTLTSTAHAPASPLPADERDFLLVIGRVLSLKDQQQTASEMISRLDGASLAQANQSMPFVQPLIVDYVKNRLDALDFSAAADMITRMRQAGMVASEACQTLLLMRWSSHERRAERYDQAIEILSQRLELISPQLAKERMAATLAEARESLAETGNYEQIVSLHRKWAEKLAPETRNQTLALLYHDWGNYLLKMDQPVQARAVLQQYYLFSPQADQKLLDLCSYKQTLLALEVKDYASHFELAQWAAEHDLVTEAIESYEQASSHPDLKDAAAEQIDRLRERVAVAYLNRCMKLFEQGDPRAALDEMNKLPFMPTSRKIGPEMQKLRALCHAELKRRSELRVVQAETLFQDAQRRYFLNDTVSAVQDFQGILRSFGDTPVAERAAEFLRYAQTRKTLQKMDGAALKTTETQLQVQVDSGLEREIKNLVEQLKIDEPSNITPTAVATPSPSAVSPAMRNSLNTAPPVSSIAPAPIAPHATSTAPISAAQPLPGQ